jgi:hypothetical protein
MPQTVGGTRSAVTIEAKILFLENGLEKFAVLLRKNQVRGFGHAPWFRGSCGGHGRFLGRVHAIDSRRAKPAAKSLKGPHGTEHTLGISDAALSAHFNFQDRLAQIFVVSHRDVPELKPPCLVGPQYGIGGE